MKVQQAIARQEVICPRIKYEHTFIKFIIT